MFVLIFSVILSIDIILFWEEKAGRVGIVLLILKSVRMFSNNYSNSITRFQSMAAFCAWGLLSRVRLYTSCLIVPTAIKTTLIECECL